MKEIPDYQTLMLPVLKSVADGKEHKFREIADSIAKDFGLTEEELGYLIPSGNQSIFDNRVGWAKTYLKKACLIEYNGKGILKITEGRKARN